MRTILFLSICTALLLQAGCGGDHGRPADLPRLFPVSITITQENQPLEGATVTVVSKTPSKYGTSSGTTNASGTVTLRTYGFNGVPAGEYAVMVTRVGDENQRESLTPEGETVMVGGQAFNYVDVQFSDESTTPLSLTVTERGARETFEVGAPVRIFLGNNPG